MTVNLKKQEQVIQFDKINSPHYIQFQANMAMNSQIADRIDCEAIGQNIDLGNRMKYIQIERNTYKLFDVLYDKRPTAD